ncbi:hypothetical protein MKW98_017186 [Papaver atlanticum]|uniref:Dynamin stalk domain-containing protein n=1 Tax=Papaver atlanticum TaxID=357466 RepID=A0AAD4SC39_9MAGN|nr:hypothetical protein MKW98_017186 [Papaver atlanticum]
MPEESCTLLWRFVASSMEFTKNVLTSYAQAVIKIYNVSDNQLPAALNRLQFDKQLAMENVRKLITEADGYQPYLTAPEQGYRRLIESSLITIRGPAEAAIDAVHSLLKDLVHEAVRETGAKAVPVHLLNPWKE